MQVPTYLHILWRSKWLLLVGIVLAAVAGFFAGFSIQDGQIVQRAQQTYTSSSTVLVSSNTQPLYQAVIPGQALVEGQTQATDVDLTSKAILYAYLVSGQDMRTQVEQAIGPFSDTEALRALRRTTQPGGDEAFPGRYSLPIIDVVGVSTDPDRASQISQTATSDFMSQVVADQDAAQIAPADRVILSVLDVTKPTAIEGSNPMIPVVVTFLGIFLLFVAAAFIIAGSRASRAAKRSAAESDAQWGDVDGVPPSVKGRRRRASTTPAPLEEPATELADEAEQREPAPVG